MIQFLIKINKNNFVIPGSTSRRLPMGFWECSGNVRIHEDKKNVCGDSDFPEYYKITYFDNILTIHPSLFSIYPIYYYEDPGLLLISSRISLIEDQVRENLTINKKFILEQILFNYSISDSTIYREIKLVPANTALEVSNTIMFKKNLTIEDYFVKDAGTWTNNLEELVDLFIDSNKNSINNGDFISFTGGFDGRSLVALGKYLNKDFQTYSFGNEGNDDLTLPRSQAKALNIPFTPINLDEEYVQEYWKLGSKLINDFSLNSNLAQVHWYYAAKILSTHTDTLVTGIFGSELFRTLNLPGQFMSRHIINLISALDNKSWAKSLNYVPELQLLKIQYFQTEFEEIVEELYEYKSKNSNLKNNLLLYKFGYEESFRKFFGSQFIVPMSDFVKVKFPYLNWPFIKALLGSKFSSVNNEFMTENPLKRFKGQQFYVELIKRTYPVLLKYQTHKGYSPGDLLSICGKIRITKSFFSKRLKRKIHGENLDNLSIVSARKVCEDGIADLNKIPLYDDIFLLKTLRGNEFANNELLRNKSLENIGQLLFTQNKILNLS